jgi:hypothetical protein
VRLWRARAALRPHRTEYRVVVCRKCCVAPSCAKVSLWNGGRPREVVSTRRASWLAHLQNDRKANAASLRCRRNSVARSRAKAARAFPARSARSRDKETLPATPVERVVWLQVTSDERVRPLTWRERPLRVRRRQSTYYRCCRRDCARPRPSVATPYPSSTSDKISVASSSMMEQCRRSVAARQPRQAVAGATAISGSSTRPLGSATSRSERGCGHTDRLPALSGFECFRSETPPE